MHSALAGQSELYKQISPILPACEIGLDIGLYLISIQSILGEIALTFEAFRFDAPNEWHVTDGSVVIPPAEPQCVSVGAGAGRNIEFHLRVDVSVCLGALTHSVQLTLTDAAK